MESAGTGGGVEAGGGPGRGLRRALAFLAQNRGFALVWAGEALTALGDRAFFVVVACLVLELTHSSLAMGRVLLCLTVPGVVFLIMGGVASDRLSRRAVLLSALGGRMLLYFAMAAIALLGRGTMGPILVVSLVYGVVESFHNPALTALVPDLVGSAGLLRANGLIEVARNGMGFVGAMAGGVLVGAFGYGPAFCATAAVLSLAAGAVALVPAPARPPAAEAAVRPPGLMAEIREGLGRLGRDARLIVFCVLMALGQFAVGGPLDAVLPRLAVEYLGAGPQGYGALTSFLFLGSLVSALGLSAAGGRLRRRGLVAVAMFLAMGLALALLPFVGGVPAGCAVMVLMGIILILFRMTYVTLAQTVVEERLRGRVMSLMMTATVAVSPFSYPAFGALADAVSPPAAFLAGGGMMAVCGLCALGVAALRRTD